MNDTPERWGKIKMANKIPVDSVANILANKITAIISRDETKDIFDIVAIAMNYSFTWEEVFNHAIKKAVIAESDVISRLRSFPVELFKQCHWLYSEMDYQNVQEKLDIIIDDFIFARDNSLGKNKIHISKAVPVM